MTDKSNGMSCVMGCWLVALAAGILPAGVAQLLFTRRATTVDVVPVVTAPEPLVALGVNAAAGAAASQPPL